MKMDMLKPQLMRGFDTMKLSTIFENQPESWGLRGDPYFWEYLKNQAESMDILSPEDLEAWIKKEHFELSGVEMTTDSMAYVEQFAHEGMSSGGISGEWWNENGIPMLKSRLS